MSYLYEIKGTFNANPIKTKHFRHYSSAIKYLDSLLTSLDVEIEEIFTSANSDTYVANNYSRFVLTKLA